MKTAESRLKKLKETLRSNLAQEARWLSHTRTGCDSLESLLDDDEVTINYLTALLKDGIKPDGSPKDLLVLATALEPAPYNEEIDYDASRSYFMSIEEYARIIGDTQCAKAAQAFVDLIEIDND